MDISHGLEFQRDSTSDSTWAAWTPQPTMRTTSPGSQHSRRSLALVKPRKHRTSAEDWGPHPPCGRAQRPAGRPSYNHQNPSPQPQGTLHTRDPRLGSRNRHPICRSPSKDDAASTFCRYQRHFVAQAQKCINPEGTDRRETDSADIKSGTCLRRTRVGHFVTDRISKRQFLVDTGSELACVPQADSAT
jgi:hypothetical protein